MERYTRLAHAVYPSVSDASSHSTQPSLRFLDIFSLSASSSPKSEALELFMGSLSPLVAFVEEGHDGNAGNAGNAGERYGSFEVKGLRDIEREWGHDSELYRTASATLKATLQSVRYCYAFAYGTPHVSVPIGPIHACLPRIAPAIAPPHHATSLAGTAPPITFPSALYPVHGACFLHLNMSPHRQRMYQRHRRVLLEGYVCRRYARRAHVFRVLVWERTGHGGREKRDLGGEHVSEGRYQPVRVCFILSAFPCLEL